MKALGWLPVVLMVSLAWGASAPAQVSQAEKHQFEEVKSQAERGDAQAQLTLGNYYASGRGVHRDQIKAVKWHRKAAEQGLARAQFRLAYEYANGLGVKPDHLEAARWLRLAAQQGLAEAQSQLGACYAQGDGVEEDAVEAAKWYRKGAEQGYPEAEHALGTCYFEGNGVTKDLAEGVAWTRKAAEQGLAAAEDSLGMCYAKGRGVPQDYLQAYKWFSLAAAQGNDANVEAKMNLSMAERAMTPAQIAQAQEMARQFKPETAEASKRDGAQKGSTAHRTTTPKGQVGLLTVKADDETDEVYLDGDFVGNAPAKLELAPGLHTVEVKKPGFKAFRRQIKVSEGSELSLHAVMERQ